MGLDLVRQVKPIAFKWKPRDAATSSNVDLLDYGFSAQSLLKVTEVDENLECIVDRTNEDKLRIRQNHLIPIIVQAIKDLKRKIEILEHKIAMK